MTAILKPKQQWSIIPASLLAGVAGQNVLIVGQMLPAGTATADALLTELTNDTSVNNALFGRTSHIAGMVRNFKRENGISRLDAIPLADDGGATQGTAVIAFVGGGGAGEAGTLTVAIGSENDHQYEIDVEDADTITEIGDKLVALTDADLDAPFTGVNAAGTVTYTAENGGTLCNDWDIRVSGSVSGITITLTGWTGGATDPSLTGILDVIGNIRYQTIIWASAYSLATVQTLLDARFNADNQILDGVAIQLKKGTSTEVKAYADQNSQSVVVVANKTISETDRKGTAVPEMPDTLASQIGAIRALRRTEGASLTQYLTTVAPKDQFGGIAQASLPYFNTALPNCAPALEQDMFTETEQNSMEASGVSMIGSNRAFNACIFGAFVTTYLTDTAGNPDLSYKYLNTVDTISVIREFFYENFRSNYAQTRLTDGDLVQSYDMANAGSIRAFSNELYDELADDVLVQKGRVAKQDFNDNMSVETEISTGTALVDIAPLLVTQLRVVLGTIQVNFSS